MPSIVVKLEIPKDDRVISTIQIDATCQLTVNFEFARICAAFYKWTNIA